jgi:photosystem II stability/assembly factor-like uncharacterized protein
VYTGADGRIFRSADGGRTWRALDVGRRAAPLAFDPHKAGTLYASDLGTPVDLAGAGILKSTDGGNSWRALSAGPTAAQVKTIVVDPRNPGIAYAAVDGRGVFKRTAGRRRAANKGLGDLSVHAVAVDASSTATVYAGTETGVFRSTDGARSWHAVGLDAIAVRALALHPEYPGIVYAATGGILVKNPNGRLGQTGWSGGGPSWEVVTNYKTQSSDVLAFDPLKPETQYVGGLGLMKTVDGGASWRRSGLTGIRVHALALDPKEPTVLYAGTDAGLFTSTDAGTTWRALGHRLTDAKVFAVALDPEERQTIYAGTDTGVFLSTDRGATWSKLGGGLPLRTYDALAVDRAARRLYAGALGAGIYELRLPR